MNWPNILTVSRVFLTFLFIYLIVQDSFAALIMAIGVFTLASLTDFWDGYLAKKYLIVSDFGKIMDPIADKVLMLSAFGIFAYIGIIPWWMFIAIALREVVVTGSRLVAVGKGTVLAAERAGKIKTVVQIVTIFIILFFLVAQRVLPVGEPFYHVKKTWLSVIDLLMVITVFLTIGSGARYFQGIWKKSNTL